MNEPLELIPGSLCAIPEEDWAIWTHLCAHISDQDRQRREAELAVKLCRYAMCYAHENDITTSPYIMKKGIGRFLKTLDHKAGLIAPPVVSEPILFIPLF